MVPNQNKPANVNQQTKPNKASHKAENIPINLENPGEELFGDTAWQIAQILVSPGDKKNTPTQVRRFYDEIVFWHERIELKKTKEARKEEFNLNLPYIRMIKAKLAYACGRGFITKDFYKTFFKIIEQIKSPETLKNAKLFFESYLGFAKFEMENKPKPTGNVVRAQKPNQGKEGGQYPRRNK